MQGLVFDVAPARMAVPALTRPLGRALSARLAPALRLGEVDRPQPPTPAWARVRPLAAGICGSDVAQVTLQADLDSPVSAIPSFPHVMGHEVVGEVIEAAADGAGPALGTLVAVDPWLGCEPRGLPPCPACASGAPPLCVHHDEPVGPGLGRGMHLGHVRGLPGGFAAEMVVHRARLHPVPEGISALAASLCDPLAVGGRAADACAGAVDAGPADAAGGAPAVEAGAADAAAGTPDRGPVLVLGAGSIGLGAVAVLRRRHPGLDVLVTCAWPHLREEAVRLGAEPVAISPDAAVRAVAARAPRARVVRPWRGGAWLAGGGACAVVDTIGTAATLTTALRVVRPRGRVVCVGVGRSGRAQMTLAYLKEVELRGSNGYGSVPGGAGVFEEAFAMLGEGLPARWVTHTLPLREWRRAFAIAGAPGRHRSIKVTIVPE